MIHRINYWLGELLYKHPFLFILLYAVITLILIAAFILSVHLVNPVPSCEIIEKGIHYEFKGDERFYPWEKIRHVKLMPHRLPGRDFEKVFALKYTFDLSGPVCNLEYDTRSDMEEIKKVERLIEENGLILEVVPLREEDLKNMRYYYNFDGKHEEMEYVIRLFSR